jgi:hypothetical protein
MAGSEPLVRLTGMTRRRGYTVLLSVSLLAGTWSCGDDGPVHVVDARAGAGSRCSIAADGDKVVVAYMGPSPAFGLYVARSYNRGASFEASKTVLVDGGGAGGTSVGITGDTIYVAYGACTPTGGAEVRFARSDDGGDTFVVQAISDRSFRPSMAIDGRTIYLAYGLESSSDDFLIFERSDDGGATWAPPVTIGADVGAYISLAASGGTLFAAYFHGSSEHLTVSSSTDGGQTWNTGQPLDSLLEPTAPLVATPDGIFVPLVDETGQLSVADSTDSGVSWTRHGLDVAGAYGASSLVGEGGDPIEGAQIAVVGSTMYAMLRHGDFTRSSTVFARSDDAGATWPPAGVVTASTASGPAEDAALLVTADSVPTVLFAFEADNLLLLRSTDGGVTWR